MSLNTKLEQFKAAAEALVNEYTAEIDQCPVDCIGHHPLIAVPLDELMTDAMRSAALTQVMDYVRGNQSAAADLMGVNRATLRIRLKNYGLFEVRRRLASDNKEAA